MSDIVLIGTGGLARETVWALPPGRVRGFVTHDVAEHGTQVCGLPVLGEERWLIGRDDVAAVCCIGDPRARRRIVGTLESEGVRFETVIHPSALMCAHVEIGEGCIIGARATLTTQVTLGRQVIVGVGTTVSHDCTLADFATLAPGVVLAGSVQIDEGAELGAGVTAKPGTRVQRGALVGAAAAVIADVEANSVVAGVPARPLRRFAPEDHF